MSADTVLRAACNACGELYVSSAIKAPEHRSNATAKAVRLAQAHCEALSTEEKPHVVEVSGASYPGDSRPVSLMVVCRCASCGKFMPGNASGICSDCVLGRL